jgi:flagellar hook-length control protein FliK
VLATAQQQSTAPAQAWPATTPPDKKPDNKLDKPDNPGLHLGVNHIGHPLRPSEVREAPADQPSTPTTSAPRTLDTLTDRVAPAPAAPAAPAGPAATTPMSVPAPSTPAVTAPTTTSPTSAPVAIPDQVFGEVTSLTSRGNGTHRITMKLQPEALGEVRVVLTMRDGNVVVRLAAGQEARAALVAGSPELRQLLEHAGATETRIVVRELPASAVSPVNQPAPQTPTTDTTTAPMNSGLTDGDRSPDRHAGTRADHLATDGDGNSRGHRTSGRRDVTPIRSVIDSHTTAVDLTM